MYGLDLNFKKKSWQILVMNFTLWHKFSYLCNPKFTYWIKELDT